MNSAVASLFVPTLGLATGQVHPVLDALAGLDWLAVAVATVAYYLLGAAWFSPLFGKAWDAAIGVERSRGHRFSAAYYVVPFVTSLVVSVAVATVITALGPARLGEALLLGLLIGVGVAAAVSITNALTPHTPRPFLFGAVTGGYHAVGITLVAAIVGAFGTG